MIKDLPFDEIKRKYQEGATTIQLGNEYNISNSEIGRLLKRKGVVTRQRSEAQLKRELPADEIVERYQSGVNTYRLAKEYDVSDSAIWRLLKREGIKLRNPSEAHLRKILPNNEIIRKYQNETSVYALAKEYKVSRNAIKTILKKGGILNEGLPNISDEGKKNKSIELLTTTNKTFQEIGNEVKLCARTIMNIQIDAINSGILEEKYRRLAGGVIQYQKDETLEMLKNTDYSLTEISRKIGLSRGAIINFQNNAIERGILEEKYKRVKVRDSLEQTVDMYIGAGK
jgi:predicted DNA-binding protein YlxM (UPF0122 family)